jgi:uncharacterized membrane protein YhaH (DUF805 family)
MDWGNYLFSVQGRINRAKYWLFVLVSFVVLSVLGIFLYAVIAAMPALTIPAGIIAVLVYLALLYAGIAVAIKRLHDRDKSGWWLLLFFLVPSVLSGIGQVSGSLALSAIFGLAALAIMIWAFVELGCLRGTVGSNAYGPDPLGDIAIAPAARMR